MWNFTAKFFIKLIFVDKISFLCYNVCAVQNISAIQYLNMNILMFISILLCFNIALIKFM